MMYCLPAGLDMFRVVVIRLMKILPEKYKKRIISDWTPKKGDFFYYESKNKGIISLFVLVKTSSGALEEFNKINYGGKNWPTVPITPDCLIFIADKLEGAM